MSHSYQLIGSVVSRLNSNLSDEYNGTRNGDYVFGPDQKINFNRFMPKYQVVFNGETTVDKSIGNDFTRTKNTTISVYAFSKRGDTGSYSQLKNRDLILYLLDKAEESLKSYRMDNFSLIGVGDIEDFNYITEQSTYLAAKPFIYKRRES